MTNKLFKTITAAALAFVMGTGVAMSEELSIGLMVPSPVGDVGWGKSLSDGLDAVKEKHGDKVKVSIIENVSDGPDAARIMNQMTADGNKFIVLGSFGYMNAGLKLARSNPDVSIIHASGYKKAKNMSAFAAKYFEGAYLMGMAAAELTKTKKLGVVSAFAIPELITTINGFALGARSVDPEIEVNVIWVNSWFDPAKEQSSAEALISQGADVIFSNAQDTPSVVSAAEKAGVYVFNLNSSMKKYAPTKYLGVVETNWGPYFNKSVEAHLAGTFEGNLPWLGMAEDTIINKDWNGDISPEMMEKIKAKEAAIKSGEFNVFAGPLTNQKGEEVIAAGKAMTDQEILGMDWHVDAVKTPIAK